MSTAARLRPLRLLIAGAMAAACAATAGCASTGVTSSRLENSIAPTFTRLYRWQQQLQGRPAPGRLDTQAQCVRGVSGHSGAGQWTCTIQYFEAGPTTPVSFSYDVSVHPDGCWTAENGPSSLGRPDLRTESGKTVPNPLYAVDGCFQAT